MKTFFFENTGNDYKLGKFNFCFNFHVKVCALYTQDKRGGKFQYFDKELEKSILIRGVYRCRSRQS